jgi:hypothetical protein
VFMEHSVLSRHACRTPCRIALGTVWAGEQISAVVCAIPLLTFRYSVRAVDGGNAGQEAICVGAPLGLTVFDIGWSVWAGAWSRRRAALWIRYQLVVLSRAWAYLVDIL